MAAEDMAVEDIAAVEATKVWNGFFNSIFAYFQIEQVLGYSGGGYGGRFHASLQWRFIFY